jgi:hypothetical protein
VSSVSAILGVFMIESMLSYVDQKVMKGKVEGPEARWPILSLCQLDTKVKLVSNNIHINTEYYSVID